MMAPPDPITTAVYDSWQAIISRDVFDPDQPLALTGVDSLRLLQFALKLEELGAAVSYDLLSPDITARSLVARLRMPDGAAPPPQPLIFMLGGVGGDEAMLGKVRHALAETFDFCVLEAPGAEQSADVLTDLCATAVLIAGQIDRRQPHDPLRLMGYSYGGLLAFEAARWLIAQGRTIALLCLLDAAPVRGSRHRLMRALARPRSLPRKIMHRLPQWRRGQAGPRPNAAVEMAYRLGAYGVASWLMRNSPGTGENSQAWLADRLDVWSLRVRAGRNWQPTRLAISVPTVLLVSEDGRGWGTPRFWQRLLPELAIVHVPGAHGELATPAALQIIADTLAPWSAGNIRNAP